MPHNFELIGQFVTDQQELIMNIKMANGLLNYIFGYELLEPQTLTRFGKVIQVNLLIKNHRR